jgi:hypothetical protein
MMAAEVEALERRQQTHLVEQGVLEKMEALLKALEAKVANLMIVVKAVRPLLHFL